MVELRTRKRGMSGDGGNDQEKLGLREFRVQVNLPCPDTAGMSPDPACNTPDQMSSQPSQARRNPDVSYPLVIASFSFVSPISLFLVHNSTIIAEHKAKPSLSISPCQEHELTLSTAYTEDSIH
jgi:hypothetical protein